MHWIRFLFCAISKLGHNNVVNHQYTRHKTQGIVITYVLLFDWKNIISGAQFYLFWRCTEIIIKHMECVIILPPFLLKTLPIFLYQCSIDEHFSWIYNHCLVFQEIWCTREHIWYFLLNKEWAIGIRSKLCIDHTWTL